MKTSTIWAIILIIALAVLVYNWGKVVALLKGAKAVNGGLEPTVEDENCRTGTQRTTARAAEICTKPIYQVLSKAKQRAWTMESVDYPFDVCAEKVVDNMGKTWYFNFQSGSHCVYVDDNRYKF